MKISVPASKFIKTTLLILFLILFDTLLLAKIGRSLNEREKRVINAGEKLGIVQGLSFGSFCINDITRNYRINSNIKLAILTGTTLTINYFLGKKLGNITSTRIVSTSPEPLYAMGQGAAYGAIDGAIIGSVSYLSMLTLGYLTNTFEFGYDQNFGQLARNGIVVGTYLGGSVGLVWGIYGISISLYIGY